MEPVGPRRTKTLGQPLTGHADSVTSAAFTRDGRRLATTSTDKTVRLWEVADAANARSLGVLSGPLDAGNAVAFSPTTQLLSTGTSDNLLQIWNLDEEYAIHRICPTTRNVLTAEIWKQHLPRLSFRPPCPYSVLVPNSDRTS